MPSYVKKLSGKVEKVPNKPEEEKISNVLNIGLDVGSTTVKLVVLNGAKPLSTRTI